MNDKINEVFDLNVYDRAFKASRRIFDLTKNFPYEERFALTDQLRRSSRSVCANLAEAWRKRKYRAHFLSKLSDCAAEAEETRVWLRYCMECGYVKKSETQKLDKELNIIIGQFVTMMSKPDKWLII